MAVAELGTWFWSFTSPLSVTAAVTQLVSSDDPQATAHVSHVKSEPTDTQQHLSLKSSLWGAARAHLPPELTAMQWGPRPGHCRRVICGVSFPSSPEVPGHPVETSFCLAQSLEPGPAPPFLPQLSLPH